MEKIYKGGEVYYDDRNNQMITIFRYVGCGLYLCKVAGFVSDGEGDLVDLGYCPVNESELNLMEPINVKEVIR